MERLLSTHYHFVYLWTTTVVRTVRVVAVSLYPKSYMNMYIHEYQVTPKSPSYCILVLNK